MRKKYTSVKVNEVENIEKPTVMRHSKNINDLHDKSLSLGVCAAN